MRLILCTKGRWHFPKIPRIILLCTHPFSSQWKLEIWFKYLTLNNWVSTILFKSRYYQISNFSWPLLVYYARWKPFCNIFFKCPSSYCRWIILTVGKYLDYSRDNVHDIRKILEEYNNHLSLTNNRRENCKSSCPTTHFLYDWYVLNILKRCLFITKVKIKMLIHFESICYISCQTRSWIVPKQKKKRTCWTWSNKQRKEDMWSLAIS